MTLYGWWWIDCQSTLILFPSSPLTLRRIIQRLFIDEIVFLHGVLLSLILNRGAKFTPRFWRSFKKCWVLKWNYAPLFIPKWMVKQSTIFKLLMICLELVYLISRKFGMNTFLWLSSLITIVIIQLYPCLLLRPFIIRRCRSPIGWFEVGES